MAKPEINRQDAANAARKLVAETGTFLNERIAALEAATEGLGNLMNFNSTFDTLESRLTRADNEIAAILAAFRPGQFSAILTGKK